MKRIITDISGSFILNNGVKMPYLGLGVFECENVEKALHWAFEKGYRHVDTASLYGNEKEVGKAIQQTSIPREEIFVVSKVWNSDQGYQNTIDAFNRSLDKMELDYLDLYLVHWYSKSKSKETWKALEYLYEKGRVRAIGVCNYLQYHLEELMEEAEVIPMINQMEFHPYLVQQELVDFCNKNNIQYEAWSPLMKKGIFEIEMLKKLSTKYQKSIAQIVLRWDLQKGIITIPKSSNKNRIEANADIFDFELSEEDILSVDQLDRNHRIGPHPEAFSY